MPDVAERPAKTATPVADNLLPQNRNAAVISAAFDLKDVTLVTVKGIEQLSQPFQFEVTILSRRRIRNFTRIIGEPLTVALKLADKSLRYFNGVVRHFAYIGLDDSRRPIYVADVVPWFATLDFRRNSRIFQNMTSLEIVKKVFRDHPKCLFRDNTTTPVPKRTYCVQYNETDLAFVSRLLEGDGIYYYFTHHKNKHELLLVDGSAGHTPCEPRTIETNLSLANLRARDDVFWDWRESVSLQSAQVALRDYNFEVPNAQLTSLSPVPSVQTGGMPTIEEKRAVTHRQENGQNGKKIESTAAGRNLTERELFYYPGKYTDKATGDFYTRIRSEEIAAETYSVEIIGDVRQLRVGNTFVASNPFEIANTTIAPKPDDKWLALRTEIEITGEGEEDAVESPNAMLRLHANGRSRLMTPTLSAEKDEKRLYRCAVTAVPATTQYRPPRRTPAPLISGPQTAIVVGLQNEVITTDRYARIKVQFMWDREGSKNEKSSCWIRVSQDLAGKNFGAVVIPRIGQEVVVEFLNGDPDQPLVTGVVYNAANMPPDDLPKESARTTLRTRTIGGASNEYNELSFDDDPGYEEAYLRSQRNLTFDSGESCEINTTEEFKVRLAKNPPWETNEPEFMSGSQITATPDEISLVVATTQGKQALVINADGVFIIGQEVGLMSVKRKPIVTVPIIRPLPVPAPPLADVFEKLYPRPNVADVAADIAMGRNGNETKGKRKSRSKIRGGSQNAESNANEPGTGNRGGDRGGSEGKRR
jgi:type VI secretion system secreted protein VgrG